MGDFSTSAVSNQSFGVGFGAVEYSSRTDGPLNGEMVKLNPESKSEIQKPKSHLEEADRLDDFVLPPIHKRDVRSNKKVSQKRELLRKFVENLGKRTNDQQYKDCEDKIARLMNRVITQMRERGARGDGSERATFDDKPLAELLLEEAALSFSEVTEQHNMLNYLSSINDFETGHAEVELATAEKMLKRLDNRTDGKGIELRKDYSKRIEDLSSKIEFSGAIKSELEVARQTLQNAHGQEIKDGYNVIPKVAGVVSPMVEAGTERVSVISVADAYRSMLSAGDCVTVLDICCETFGVGEIEAGCKIMMAVSGLDIDSVNPSRDMHVLIAVRDALYWVEVSVQLSCDCTKVREKDRKSVV
jgi:hypothetical protein